MHAKMIFRHADIAHVIIAGLHAEIERFIGSTTSFKSQVHSTISRENILH